jgi:hypothetical protein
LPEKGVHFTVVLERLLNHMHQQDPELDFATLPVRDMEGPVQIGRFQRSYHTMDVAFPFRHFAITFGPGIPRS